MSPSSATDGFKLVVLDRDGVINADSPDFVRSAADWRPLPGSLEAIAALTAAGWTVVVATNQSGLARGHFCAGELARIHEKMCAAARAAGGRIDGIFICPHGPGEGCECRKPAPGLFRQIEAHYGRSVAGAPAIGDSVRDVQAARRAGARAILVLTGNGRQAQRELVRAEGPAAVESYPDLAAAASALIEEDRR